MRVPSTGQPLYERRIVREGKRLAERMLEGYSVTASGRLVPNAAARDGAWLDGFVNVVQALGQRAARVLK